LPAEGAVVPEAIVGVEGGCECAGALVFVAVAVGVRLQLEQGTDEALGFAVGLRPVGAGLLGFDPPLLAGVAPAAFEAGAVVGEDALDGDAVAGVEALELIEEGEGGGRALAWVDTREAEACRIVDGG
jgi:hypothetical protein